MYSEYSLLFPYPSRSQLSGCKIMIRSFSAAPYSEKTLINYLLNERIDDRNKEYINSLEIPNVS